MPKWNEEEQNLELPEILKWRKTNQYYHKTINKYRRPDKVFGIYWGTKCHHCRVVTSQPYLHYMSQSHVAHQIWKDNHLITSRNNNNTGIALKLKHSSENNGPSHQDPFAGLALFFSWPGTGCTLPLLSQT